MAIRMFYGREIFRKLGITDMREYGFNTVQLPMAHSGTPKSELDSKVGVIDRHFQPDPGLVIAINFWNHNPEGSGDPHVCPGYSEGDYPVGKLDREGWYNTPNSPFYCGIKNLIQDMVDYYGNRIKGVRWNHEIPPNMFKTGDEWVRYAEEHNEEDYDAVTGSDAETAKWNTWLRQLAGGDHDNENMPELRERDAYFGGSFLAGTIWGNSVFSHVQGLYRTFVDFQVTVQRAVIERIAGDIAKIRPENRDPLKFIVYTPQQGPTVYAKQEYTLELDSQNNSNIWWEIGTWDGQSAGDRNAWAQQAQNAVGSQYFFTLQQKSTASNFAANINNVVSSIEHMLDPEGPTDPESIQFGFWNDWKPGVPGQFSEDQQRQYMNKVKEALTD